MTTHRNLKPHYAERKGKSGPVIRIPAPLSDSDDYQPNEFREPVEPRKCVRHKAWRIEDFNDGTDRLIQSREVCVRCGHVRNAALVRRGRESRNYGTRAELTAARKYGGDKIGAAGGPVDIRGKDFSTQLKTHRRTPPKEWTTVFAKMAQEQRCPRLLARFVMGPGVPPKDYFVFEAEAFLEWFGRDE